MGPLHYSIFAASFFSADLFISGQTSFVSATYSSSTLGQTLDCALQPDAVDWVGEGSRVSIGRTLSTGGRGKTLRMHFNETRMARQY